MKKWLAFLFGLLSFAIVIEGIQASQISPDLLSCKIQFRHDQEQFFSRRYDADVFCSRFRDIFGDDLSTCSIINLEGRWRGRYGAKRVFFAETRGDAWLEMIRYFERRSLHRYDYQYRFQFFGC